MAKRFALLMVLIIGAFVLTGVATTIYAQDDAVEVAPGIEVEEEAATTSTNIGFFRVVTGSGFLGVVLWLALGICSVAGFALIVDSFVTIRPKKIVPEEFVEKVRTSMEQGDVMKAIKHCDEEPGPLSNILSAGFSNVQEGFEVIQDTVGVSADMESEKLMQRVTYLNVVGNLAPMLGLLGTVQGMIFAFATLGTAQGAAAQSALAMNISQALFTTAAGLCVAVPALGFFYFFRNRATTIILGMEALTLDLIKSLRNVEVVEE